MTSQLHRPHHGGGRRNGVLQTWQHWPYGVASGSTLGAVVGVSLQSGAITLGSISLATGLAVLGVGVVATTLTSPHHDEFTVLRTMIAVPLLVVVGVAGGVAVRAAVVESDRLVDLPPSVSGDAVLRTDPHHNGFGLQAVISVAGRRYLATFAEYLEAEVSPMLLGETLTVIGTTRTFDQDMPASMRGWLRSQHLVGRVQIIRAEATSLESPFMSAVNAVHRHISNGAQVIEHDDHRSLYTGILLGDDRQQSDLLDFQFTATGMTHLLAVSGQNIAIVLTLISQVTRRMTPKAALGTMLIAIVFFGMLTRAEPSVIRACLMASMACVGAWLGKTVPATRLLSVTIAVMVIVDPLVVFALGFQLSVLATLGILWINPKLQTVLRGPQWMRETLATTLAAQVGTIPLVCIIAGGIPAATILANFFATPASGVVMGVGATLGNLVAVVPTPLGQLLILPAHIGVWWIALVGNLGSQLPLMFLTPGRLILFVTSLATVILVWSRPVDTWVRIVGVICLVIQLWSTPVVGSHQVGVGTEVHIGSCLGTVVVVREVSRSSDIVHAIWKLGVRRVDALVVTTSTAGSATAAIVAQQFQAASTHIVHSHDDAVALQVALRQPCGRSPTVPDPD